MWTIKIIHVGRDRGRREGDVDYMKKSHIHV